MADNIVVRCENCVSDVATGEYPLQTMVIYVTCDPDFTFQVTPYISWSYFYLGRVRSGDYAMEKVDDTTYTYEITLAEHTTYYIYGEAVKSTVVTEKYGLITVYRITTDELKAISRKRFRTIAGSNGNYQYQYYDTAQYISKLFKLYVSLESDHKQELYFGPYDMGIECDVIDSDIITVDCGSILINGIHGNSIDYEKTDIQAYLPFIGFVDLPTVDFMDKEIHLHYQINVINGDALAVFTHEDNPIFSQSCNASFDVPFELSGSEKLHTEIQPNTNYLLDTPPFVYIKSHNALDPDTSLPYHDTKFYARFGDLSGYTEAQEIDFKVLSDTITKTEIDEIISLLENGVFL